MANRFTFFLAMFASLLLAFDGPAQDAPAAGEYFVYVGTYTAAISKGIYGFRFQPSTGELIPLGVMAEAPNPSFLVISPNSRFLYAVNWKGSDTVEGNTVSAYALNPHTGKLTFLNKVSSKGEMPTHLLIDPSGRTVLVANYGSGSVAALPVQPNGRLSEATWFDQHPSSGAVKNRQTGPHAHSVVLSPDKRFALVADLGLDEIFSYRFDAAKSSLSPNDPPFTTVGPDSGPRHMAFHPNGRFLYVNNQDNSTVAVFAYYQAGGTLKELQTISTLPPDFTGKNTTAEIQTDSAGKFLYVSNRGHDSIAVFAIGPREGTLTSVEHVSTQGKSPRNFSLDATGSYLFAANENSSNIVLIHVDRNTGRLTPTGKVVPVGSPSCVIFLKAQP